METGTVEWLTGTTADLESKNYARFGQYDRDEKLWRGEKYILEEIASDAPEKARQYPAFTSNDPRNLADLIIGMLIRHALVAKGDLYEPKTMGQEDELSVHERFATGLWREIDVIRALSNELPFQSDLSWFHAIRGGSVVRWWVYKKQDEHPFDVAIWDPWDVVWRRRRLGHSFICHHYRADVDDVKEAWGVEDPPHDSDDRTEVWDGWWTDKSNHIWNGIVVGKKWVKEPVDHTKERKLTQIPILITRGLGAPIQPRVTAVGEKKWLADQWDSIFGPNREMYAQYNRAMTLFGLVIRDGPLGFLHFDFAGSTPVDKLAEQIRPLNVVQAKGKFNKIDPPQMADAAKEFVAATSGAIQRGGAPFSAFGQAPFQLSGIALSQLQGAMEIRTVRLSQSLQTVYKHVTDGIIQQFINLNRKVKLEGVDRRKRPFMEDFKAADLKVKYHLEFEHRTDLPIQQMQEANIAGVWAGLGVSLVRIYDELLHIQDPNWEYRRKLMEMADQNPVVAGLKLARDLRRRSQAAAEAGDVDEAAEFAEYADIVLGQIKGAQGQARQQMGGPMLPSPQAAPPEAFGQGGGFTMNEQNLPAEARMPEMGPTGV